MAGPLYAIVGGDRLLAKELRELLTRTKPAPRLQLISAAGDGSASILDAEEEAIVMVPLSTESLLDVEVTFLAGSPASSRRALKLDPSGILIDLTAALEDRPDALLRAPMAEPPGTKKASHLQVIAHPAAIAIAKFLSQLTRIAKIRTSIIHIFEPASERGQAGLDELQQQTVAVLSFKKLKTDVFDAQLGFNMLVRYGEEATEPLEGIEQRLERHLASLLAAWPGIPMPSLRLIQAPVFHGHSFSVWVEFEENPGVKALAKILEEGGIDVRPDDPPANAGIAGHSGLSAGAITVDPNSPRAVWFWMVADNLRLSAENAVEVAKETA